MSVVPPLQTFVRQPPWSLVSFENLMASLIVRWVRDAAELFWLAPKTEPPLTAAKVVGWPGSTGTPMLLCRENEREPLGYLELNPMPNQSCHFWVGHCLLNPAHRGQGFGKRMVEMVLHDAFLNRGSSRVSLVVFPENEAAVQCYYSAGFELVGEQRKHFPVTGRLHVMLQMSIDAGRYTSRAAR